MATIMANVILYSSMANWVVVNIIIANVMAPIEQAIGEVSIWKEAHNSVMLLKH